MKLNVFTYKTTETAYSYDKQLEVTKAPEDADWNRWAMLYDGTDYRLFCFKKHTNNVLYQFAFNGTAYEFGHNSIPEVTISNLPETAYTLAFAMLHDGTDYRLYVGSAADSDSLYQCVSTW